jgi:predicted alpha/beta-fold hydrolase
MTNNQYRPAWWLPNPHLQTLWSRFGRRDAVVTTRAEVWDTPDGDILEVDRLDAPTDSAGPRPAELIVLHGLEATRRSPYLRGILGEAARRGWGATVWYFRSCGDRPNRTRRFYHAGETTDLEFVVSRVARDHPAAPIVLVGYSLGGNVLLKWLGERGDTRSPDVRGAAAVSVPFDLARGARQISRGFARVYETYFLRSLKRKSSAKLAQFPDLADPRRVENARSLYDFDDAVTAPVHGFASADDYYSRSSALRFLSAIRVPTLLLSARDDPFLPASVLDEVLVAAGKTSALTLEFLPSGGHVGFVGGQPWRPTYYAERRVGDFLAATLHQPLREHHVGSPHESGIHP